TVELADRQPTEGGSNSPQAELDLLTIRSGKRFNLHSRYTQSSALTEAERDIPVATTEGAAAAFDQRPYRTLQPFSRSFGTNATYAQPIGDVSATINGELTATQSVGRFGLPLDANNQPLGGPLEQRSNAVTGHLGTSLNGRLSPRWLWTVTGAYDRADTRTFGDTNAGRDSNRAHSVSNTGEIEALVNGPLFALPAGDVSTAVRVGAQTSDFSSDSLRAGIPSGADIARDSASGRINVDLPIASRSRNVLRFLGTLSVNGNAAVNQLSDFGTLTAYGYGVNWGPVDGVRVIGSINQQDVAPTAAQLGNPQVLTPNVRVFDFVQGQTVTVTTLSGGNPTLQASDRRVTRLGLNLKPWSAKDLTLTVNYTKQDTRNPVQSFRSPTAALEAAFPDRFTRVNGTLTRLDTRPINFARAESEEIRWGINFSKPIKSKIQKQVEAFRAGTGPNPFAGLRFPGADGRRGPDGGRGAGGQGEGTPPPAGDRPQGDA
ncbi:MAG: TonB-dependent receptor, partial [Sphingomonas sp.]